MVQQSGETGRSAESESKDLSNEELKSVQEATKERTESIDEDVDSILDEIDDVLEVNAEDFVKSFIQKGGQ